ncbi:hypothetical protein DSLASN_09750 [Desulfoluna limicola]|uniref:Lipoprotein n=1 Tax=Desulfoluna limicola TaxID=2810562 RepID=A0ABM7PE37_9BACT|nr:DUF3833 domain-containing protein [Desulfoluna limicola]BCS95343.1 hypothetical protein DSLASN_09750 [Desulfoluna limicola]
MKRCRNFLLMALPAFIMLSGCSTGKVSDYEGRTPVLIPETFFDGQLTAHGVVKNRAGEVIRYFNAEMKGHWKGSVGTLEEDFVFDDGERQRRVWTLTRQDDRHYVGTAGDVIGEAKGEIAGNSMFLDYVLDVPYGDGTIHLSIDDRMYLVNPTTIVNESEMTKFGLRVGEVLLVIQKK